VVQRWAATVLAGLALLATPASLRAQLISAEPDPAPVTIDQVAKTPGGSLTPQEEAFDQQVRQSYSVVDQKQGPLEGAWRLMASDGKPLFGFQLADLPKGGVEGAWRDLRRQSALGGSGFIAEIYRDEDSLRMNFYERDGEAATEIVLTPSASGEWSGNLWDDNRKIPVIMKR
jgi:hypothetical protein